MHFLERLAQPRPLLLDGATGTELDRRGVDTRLPLWSAGALLSAPQVLEAIHADYLRAGAEILTANTFRTHRRSLAKAGLGERAGDLTRQAVAIARQAAAAPGAGPRFVAGSLSPLEDCYSPALVPPAAECEREHAEMAAELAAGGADLILVETMNTIREAAAATRAARATGLPVMTGFVCGSDGRLLSGESVAEAVRAIAPLGAVGLLINCTPATTIEAPFQELRQAAQLLAAPARPRVGLYANIGHTDSIKGWESTADVDPAEYARLTAGWLAQGAGLVGGCCGTTPAHIAAVRQALA